MGSLGLTLLALRHTTGFRTSQGGADVSEHVLDVTEQSFQQDVMDYSMTRPVLIDFWADWCGPCKALTPTLEQLADEYAGAFRLAKINADQEKRLAMAFRIQSLPTVLALYQGQPVNSFMGALPREQIKQFLDQLLTQLGVQPPESDALPKDPAMLEKHWRQKLAASPGDSESLLALGRLLASTGRADEATELLNTIDASSDDYNAAQTILATLSLMSEVSDMGGIDAVKQRLDADPSDMEARYLMACAAASQGDLVGALGVYVDLIGGGSEEIRDRAKKAAAIVFEAAGRENPEVEALRRRLTRLLF